MKTPQDYVKEFEEKFPEIRISAQNAMPVFLPNAPKETHKSFLLTSLKEYGKQCEENGRKDVVDYIKDRSVHERSTDTEIEIYHCTKGVLESARHSSK